MNYREAQISIHTGRSPIAKKIDADQPLTYDEVHLLAQMHTRGNADAHFCAFVTLVKALLQHRMRTHTGSHGRAALEAVRTAATPNDVLALFGLISS